MDSMDKFCLIYLITFLNYKKAMTMTMLFLTVRYDQDLDVKCENYIQY